MGRSVTRGWMVAVCCVAVSATAVFAQKEKGLLGAGATFPYPLYSKMFDVYHKKYDIQINYQSIGSGGGIRQLKNKTVDFGATDAFMTDEGLADAKGEIIHIPMCLGAVVVTYKLPGSPKLKLSPDVLADIFMGKIKKWNHKRIQQLNKDVTLPNLNIFVIHRSDASGTSFIFTDYMSKISSEWKKNVGTGKSVKWPTGLGAKGNEGVAGLIKQTKGSIGYCELAYTIQNDMPQAMLKNKAGNYIAPEIASISKAAAMDIPADTRVSITNTAAEQGYPVSGFTWVIVYKEQSYNNRSKEKAQSLVNLLWWMIHEGQQYCKPLDYAPLPQEAVSKAEALVKEIEYSGTELLKK